jgi:membrane protease YdiL (CAAX protease family)
MKIILFSLAWAAGFAMLGGVLMLGFGMALFHAVSHDPTKPLKLGAEIGLNAFIFAFCFAALPGARRQLANPPALGLLQGIWGMAGFGIMMLAGGLLVTNLLSVEDIVLIARHNPARVDYRGHNFLMAAACAGELAAGWWVVWYFRRLGPVRQEDGSAAGLAWRAAPPMAYMAATAWAFAIIAAVLVLYHFIPPDMRKLDSLPMAKLFTGSALSLLPLFFIATILGPALEELVFRGIAFAGIASRLGPVWAGIITTLIFMTAHAPEKIYYPPGFIDVGLMATASVLLRLQFRSIRPGIALHIIYNFGSMLAASLM